MAETTAPLECCGQSKIPLFSRVRITDNLFGGEPNQSYLLGYEGEATHPFASGCTDPGWIGVKLTEHTAYGYNVNFHETEVSIIHNY